VRPDGDTPREREIVMTRVFEAWTH